MIRLFTFPGVRLVRYRGAITLLLLGCVALSLRFTPQSAGISIEYVRRAWRVA
jgi:hypothetical protein